MVTDRTMDFLPLGWAEFFERKELLPIGNDLFNVYLKGSKGPLFFLLHGGGYTGLTWATLSEHLSLNMECQLLAPDLREHGETKVIQGIINFDNQSDEPSRDVCNIYIHLYGEDARKHPPTILIGHSMGGALAIRAVASGMLPKVVAIGVIDVVEGSAMASLNTMQKFLRNRPQHFSSVERAIEWCLKSRTTSNLRSAKISMPSRLYKNTASEAAFFQWRTNLLRTEQHWKGWFNGLSKLFLQCDSAKVLILANVDRLDKELLMGQMRGQFQLEVLPKVGHAVHEDSPELVAKIFISLVARYKIIFQL